MICILEIVSAELLCNVTLFHSILKNLKRFQNPASAVMKVFADGLTATLEFGIFFFFKQCEVVLNRVFVDEQLSV